MRAASADALNWRASSGDRAPQVTAALRFGKVAHRDMRNRGTNHGRSPSPMDGRGPRCYELAPVKLFRSATWNDIGVLRERIMTFRAPSVEECAQHLARLFAETFSSVVLARLFAVLPFARLPAADRAFATRFAAGHPGLGPHTPVLSLLGSFGRLPNWCQRTSSENHLAIPLIDVEFVQGAPMLARLLADLEVNLAGLADGRPIVTRTMLGGRNKTFYVSDAQTATDETGRHIIPSAEFVATHRVRTVFGMGGAYEDGTLATAILFTDELIERLTVDRYPSFISNFKMSTAHLVPSRLYRATAPA